MRILLATSLLLLFAIPAGAQITPGPLGPFAIVDDNGKLLGGADAIREFTWFVSLSTPQGTGFLLLLNLDPGEFGTNAIRFPTTDCSGQAYTLLATVGGEFYPAFDGDFGLTIGPNSTLYAVDTLNEAVLNYQSVLIPGGCLVTSGSHLAVPADPVGDLAAEFTPPFHIVTASQVQEASVPLLGSWSQLLLALALVLAFGAYDRSRRNQHAL